MSFTRFAIALSLTAALAQLCLGNILPALAAFTSALLVTLATLSKTSTQKLP